MDGNDTENSRFGRRSYLSGTATLGALSLAGRAVADTNRSRIDARLPPVRELAVRPGTTVLFEVESDASRARGGDRRWFVDGTPEGRSLGPWYRAYYDREGVDCWHYTFETAGTYEVAAVFGENSDSRADWTIRATPDGAAAPTIDASRPAAESLEVERDDALDLELTVADSGGNLDRVVWWLGHADALLGVSDVTGCEDTASLSLEHGCHGCPVIAWVVGEAGPITAERVWAIDGAPG